MLRFALILLALAACGGDSKMPTDNDPYATFQDCYDDHHNVESFPTVKAIEICCIDHPIGTSAMNTVCGDTTQSCQTYVTANLADAADPNLATDITTACTAYPTDRPQP